MTQGAPYAHDATVDCLRELGIHFLDVSPILSEQRESFLIVAPKVPADGSSDKLDLSVRTTPWGGVSLTCSAVFPTAALSGAAARRAIGQARKRDSGLGVLWFPENRELRIETEVPVVRMRDPVFVRAVIGRILRMGSLLLSVVRH